MKLRPQYYKRKDGDRTLNCYNVAISKEVVRLSGISPDKELKAVPMNGKILIEGKNDDR